MSSSVSCTHALLASLAVVILTGCLAGSESQSDGAEVMATRAALTGAPGTWVAQGPNTAQNGQTENLFDGTEAAGAPANNPVSGAIHTLVAHPTNANQLWIGAANGGIWFTNSATASPPQWTNQTPALTGLSIGALAMDATNAQVLVAGTGWQSSWQRWRQRTGSALTGLLITNNGGGTWAPTPSQPVLNNPNVSGLFVRGATIVVSMRNAGVFRSANGGSTWTNVTPGGGVAYDLVADPTNANRLYVATRGNPAAPGTEGIFVSVDQGATWANVSVNSPQLQQHIDAATTTAPVTSTNTNTEMALGQGGRLFVGVIISGRITHITFTDDQGANWTPMDIPAAGANFAFPSSAITSIQPQGGCLAAICQMTITLGANHNLPGINSVQITGELGAATFGGFPANGAWNFTIPNPNQLTLLGSGIQNGPNFGCGGAVPQPACTGQVFASVGTNPEEEIKHDKAPGSQGQVHFSIAVDPTNQNILYVGGDVQPNTPSFVGANAFTANIWRGNAAVASTGAVPSPQWDNLTHSATCPAAAAGCFTPAGGCTNAAGCGTPGNLACCIPTGGTNRAITSATAGFANAGTGTAGHADSREIAFDANFNLIEVGDGGIVLRVSPLGNAGDWTSLNGNLQITEAHDIAFDAVAGLIMIGNQDTGTMSQFFNCGVGPNPPCTIWTSPMTADGGDVAVDDVTSAGNSWQYYTTQNLGLPSGTTIVSSAIPANVQRQAATGAGLAGPPTQLLVLNATNPLSPSITPQFRTPMVPHPIVGPNTATPCPAPAPATVTTCGQMLFGGADALWESFDGGNTAVALPGGAGALDMVYGHTAVTGLIMAGTVASGCGGAACNGTGTFWVRTAPFGGPNPDSNLTPFGFGGAGAPGANFLPFDTAVDPLATGALPCAGVNCPTTAYVVGTIGVGGTSAVYRFDVTSTPGTAITGQWRQVGGDSTDADVDGYLDDLLLTNGGQGPGAIQSVQYVSAAAAGGPNNKIFIGADNGVFVATDPPRCPNGLPPLGQCTYGWNEVGANTLPNAPVWDMEHELLNDTLYVATIGRSTWALANASQIDLPPIAQCQSRVVPADASCQGSVTPAQIDNGSFDPDGDPLGTLALVPPGPYTVIGLAGNQVTLQVPGSTGATETCTATVFVGDVTPPSAVTAPPPIVLVNGSVLSLATLDPGNQRSASDNCTSITWRTVPPLPATLPFGPSTVQWFASDTWGNENPVPAVQQILVLGSDAHATGDAFSCELTPNGEVTCWGYGGDGRLGDGEFETRWAGGVVTLSAAVQLSVGNQHGCAVLSDGTARCWGENADGRLGAGTGFGDASTPVEVEGLDTIEQISAGSRHTCAVLLTGELYCWGENDSGRLGIGVVFGDQDEPQRVTTLNNVAMVSAGSAHTCAVLDDSSLYCWGEDADGRLGIGSVFGDQSTPQLVSTLPGVKQVSAGGAHSCAVTNAGLVYCWGAGADGRLGNGSAFDQNTPQLVSLPFPALQVSAGAAHSCATLLSQQVYCWGEDSEGRLGIGPTTQDATTPQLVPGLVDAVQVSAGIQHTCAVRSNGKQLCWGDNSFGQLGNGTAGDSSSASMVAGLCDPLLEPSGALELGRDFGCARAMLDGDSKAYCWGNNDSGQLGVGDSIDRRAPWPILGLDGVSSVSAGDHHACAALDSGELYCWGLGSDGRVGDGTVVTRDEPTQVFTAPPQGPSGNCFYREKDGRGYYFCQSTAPWTSARNNCRARSMELARIDTPDENDFIESFVTSSAWLAGNDRMGEAAWRWAEGGVDNGAQFWQGSGSLLGGVPHLFSNWSSAFEPNGGTLSNCAYTDSTGGWYDGSCNTARPYVCEAVAASVDDAALVAAGSSHTCAGTTSGKVRCWGDNLDGALGDGSYADRTTPVSVSGLPATMLPVAVTAGENHSCAVVFDFGAAALATYCWGDNGDGELGIGNFTTRTTAAKVLDLPNDIIDVRAGRDHTCALSASGRVFCWGEGASGQLGIGNLSNRNRPQEVLEGGAPLVAISLAAGDSHTCAVEVGRTLCWGADSAGQLGDNGWLNKLVPVEVTGLADAVAVGTGSDHSCATRSDGIESEVVCWGNNFEGELGDGTLGSTAEPISTGGQSCF